MVLSGQNFSFFFFLFFPPFFFFFFPRYFNSTFQKYYMKVSKRNWNTYFIYIIEREFSNAFKQTRKRNFERVFLGTCISRFFSYGRHCKKCNYFDRFQKFFRDSVHNYIYSGLISININFEVTFFLWTYVRKKYRFLASFI